MEWSGAPATYEECSSSNNNNSKGSGNLQHQQQQPARTSPQCKNCSRAGHNPVRMRANLNPTANPRPCDLTQSVITSATCPYVFSLTHSVFTSCPDTCHLIHTIIKFTTCPNTYNQPVITPTTCPNTCFFN